MVALTDLGRVETRNNKRIMETMEERVCNNCFRMVTCKLYMAMKQTIPQVFPEHYDENGAKGTLPFIPENTAKGCSAFVHIAYVRTETSKFTGQPLMQEEY